MTDRTPDSLKSMIQTRFEKRKALSLDSIEHAGAIQKNRVARAELSLEVKALTKEYHLARKEIVKLAKTDAAEARKVVSDAKKAAKALAKTPKVAVAA